MTVRPHHMTGHAALCCFLAVLSTAIALRIGDEGFADNASGKFYLFSDRQVTVVDPVGLKVIANISTDNKGAAIADSLGNAFIWGDTVYMENASARKYYVFANAYSATLQNESFVYVFDTTASKVVSKVAVGARPVHLYAIPELQTVWTHSDGLGTFDVIHIDDISKLRASQVKALANTPGHGKLVVDPDLFPRAFATNVAEQFIFEVDLVLTVDKARYPYKDALANSSMCVGLHGIAYSKVNKHIYVECVAGGGILEWNTRTNKLVAQYTDISGSLQVSRDESFVLVTEKGASRASLLKPGANGVPSSILAQFNVPGKPGGATFFPRGGVSSKNVQDYRIYFPMTANVNKQLMARAGNALSSRMYDSAPTDCTYNGTNARGQRTVVSKDCGSCVSTAFSSNAEDWDLAKSGIMWVDLSAVAAGNPVEANFIQAGAVIPGRPGMTSAECAFGLTYRTATRGNTRVLVPASLPSPSVYVINGDTAKVEGQFATTPNAKTPQYVPANDAAVRCLSMILLMAGVLASLLVS